MAERNRGSVMGGLVLGRGYVSGLGQVIIEESNKKDFFLVTVLHSNITYIRHRSTINWRPGTHSQEWKEAS